MSLYSLHIDTHTHTHRYASRNQHTCTHTVTLKYQYTSGIHTHIQHTYIHTHSHTPIPICLWVFHHSLAQISHFFDFFSQPTAPQPQYDSHMEPWNSFLLLLILDVSHFFFILPLIKLMTAKYVTCKQNSEGEIPELRPR